MTGNHPKVAIEFDPADLPALAHALAIASTTAMMCGHPTAQKRLAEYRAVVEQMIPDAARAFDGEKWCEIGIALASAASYSVHFEKWGYTWGRNPGDRSVAHGQIHVTIGGRTWCSDDVRIEREGGKLEAVRQLLHEMAPLDAVHADIPDTDFNDRHKRQPAARPTTKAPAETPDPEEPEAYNP